MTAVVILNYNGRDLLKKFLPSVIQFSDSAEIIVADNNSSDGSITLLKENFPTIRVIEIPSNLGFCGGYNYALKKIQSKYYVLLNSDVEVTQGWMKPIIDLMEADEKIGAAQPKILSHSNKQKFEYAGAAGGFIDWLGYPFCRGRIFETIEDDNHQYDSTRSVFWASGACMIVRSDLYHQLGGLDETFFAHMEEIDFCWRLHKSGRQVVCHTESTVYHVGGATLEKGNPRKTYYNFRNGLQMLIKNLSLAQLLVRLPLRVVLDWVASAKFLLGGQPRHWWAVVKAHIYVISHLGTIRKQKSLETTFPIPTIYGKSIVFDYYVMGRKKFADLSI